MLFVTWNVTQSVRSSLKQSIAMHCDRTTHPLFKLITGACILKIACFIFPVMAGLIVKMFFMLFLTFPFIMLRNGLKISSIFANGFSNN